MKPNQMSMYADDGYRYNHHPEVAPQVDDEHLTGAAFWANDYLKAASVPGNMTTFATIVEDVAARVHDGQIDRTVGFEILDIIAPKFEI